VQDNPKDDATYRADTRAYLESCPDYHVPAALTEFALYCWIAHLESEGVPEPDRRRMRSSVERLFRRIGVLADEDPDDLELAGDERLH